MVCTKCHSRAPAWPTPSQIKMLRASELYNTLKCSVTGHFIMMAGWLDACTADCPGKQPAEPVSTRIPGSFIILKKTFHRQITSLTRSQKNSNSCRIYLWKKQKNTMCFRSTTALPSVPIHPCDQVIFGARHSLYIPLEPPG